MTIHKITAGDGYTYLTRQVAAGDSGPVRGSSAAEYYTATGNPPGTWMGAGLGSLGLSGEVTEEQMTALFGQGLHPNAADIVAAYQSERISAGMTEQQLKKISQAARKAASLGRPFPEYQDLEPFDARVSARLKIIQDEAGRAPTASEEKKVRREEARRQRRAVAGFDLVFTPVSSVSRLWGLDPRPWVREAIEQAHYAARDAALKLLEDHAAHTRTGSSGQAQIETHGLIAAVFDHADNRLGEPNLHSHVAVSSKVLGSNGKWQALDARGLYRMTVAASELYNTVLENELNARLGLEFEARTDTLGKREPVREIMGFPSEVLSHFTRRRSDIEAEYQRLLTDFRAAHGRDPSLAAAHQLAQQATLATRKGKKPPRAWATMPDEWRTDLTAAFGADALAEVIAVVPERSQRRLNPITCAQLNVADVARRVVAEVQEHHATWTRWNVLAQAQRELRAVRFTTPAEQESAVAAVVNTALSTRSISTEPPELVAEPLPLRRPDGSSVFTQHGAERYTSQAVLDAEARLVESARFQTSVGIDGQTTDRVLADHEVRAGSGLDPGQRALVKAFACDGRLLLAGIGPAGAGKTTAMRVLAEVIKAGTGRLVPLATSASAAGVLAADLGTEAENLHKFLWEWTKGPHAKALARGRNVPSEAEFYALNPGDVVVVDESGMAGTLNLDRLVSIAAERGAVVRLLGDYRQLGAVESGGALRLIANECGAVELATLYRFADPIEAEATLKIRVGDTAGLDFYQDADRIRHGSRQAMTEKAYAGWKADMLAGRKALMVAATNANVAELCARARADRVAAKQVEADGVRVHDGNLAGVHDLIVTRDNDRRLRAGRRDFVKNGDAWEVVERHGNGALTVEHLEHHGRVLLPPEYVATNVELLYAATAHRAQGSTVDACHALITEEMGRENFYVIISRARQGTVLYVATHDLASVDEDEHVDAVKFDPDAYAAREILEHVVAREAAELSATEQIRTAFAEAESLSTLVPRYEHALDVATDSHYRRMVEQALPDLAEQIVNDSAWHAVLRALRDADAAGWDVPVLLTETTRSRELSTADSVAQVVSWRLRRVIDTELAPAADVADEVRHLSTLTGLAPSGDDADRDDLDDHALTNALGLAASSHAAPYARDPLLPPWLRTARPVTDSPWQPYLDARADLIRRRVTQLANAAVAERPAWTTHLRAVPTDASDREAWRTHLAAIAAYRDQYRVTDDDPDHPLGPYPESGRVGHRAYWIAAASLLALRGVRRNADPSWGRVAAHRYRTLNIEEQNRVAAQLVERLGQDWLGSVRDPASDADQPVYHRQLAAILVEDGHLEVPSSGFPSDRVPRTPSTRGRSKQHRGRPAPAIRQTPGIARTESPKYPPNNQAQRPRQLPPNSPRGPRPGA